MPHVPNDLYRRILAALPEDLAEEARAVAPDGGNGYDWVIEIPERLVPAVSGALSVGANAAMMSHAGDAEQVFMLAIARDMRESLPEFTRHMSHRSEVPKVYEAIAAGAEPSVVSHSRWGRFDVALVMDGRPVRKLAPIEGFEKGQAERVCASVLELAERLRPMRGREPDEAPGM